MIGFLMAFLAAGDASAATLFLGPFLREVGPDRAVIGFQTDVAPTTAEIEYAKRTPSVRRSRPRPSASGPRSP
jgi:hypothetical protein